MNHKKIQSLGVKNATLHQMEDSHTGHMTDFEFVLSCVRPMPELCPVEQIKSQISKGVDWRQVVQIAAYHGIMPLLFHNLKSIVHNLLPNELQADIDKYFQVTKGHNSLQLKELERLLQVLGREKIPAIVLKGRPLEVEAYGNIQARKSSDFDLLIPNDQFRRAESLLLNDGYQPFQKVEELSGLRKTINLWFAKQFPFKKYRGLFNLDLHLEMMPPSYHYPVTFNQFWERSKIINIDGVEIRMLKPEELLILLTYHGVKNQWSSLKYICDITALIESHPDLDWDKVLERTAKNRGRRFLLIGLSLSKKLLGLDLPDEIEGQIEDNVTVLKVVSLLIEVLQTKHTGRKLSYGERVQFHLSSREDYRDKVRYVSASLLVNIWATLFRQNSNFD